MLKSRIPDWRDMVDAALIDADYEGEIFNIARSDVAESEADLVAGCCLNRTRSVFLVWKPDAAVFPEIRWFIAWTIMLLVATGMGSGIWLGYRLGLTPSLDDLMLFLGFGATALVGTLLVAKRPGNLIGWIIAAIGLIAGLFPAAETYVAFVMTTPGGADLLAIVGACANEIYWMPMLALMLIYVPLLFPDGRLPSRRWLPIAVIPGLAATGLAVLGAFRESLTPAGYSPPDQQPNRDRGVCSARGTCATSGANAWYPHRVMAAVQRKLAWLRQNLLPARFLELHFLPAG